MKNEVAVIDRITIDCIYSDFKNFSSAGEEICTKNFSLSLGGGACVSISRLSSMGIPTRFGTFLGKDRLSEFASMLLEDFQLQNAKNFYNGEKCPIVYSTVFSGKNDRQILSFDEEIDENILTDEEMYNFFKGSKICFAPKRESVLEKLKKNGTIIVYDSHWVENQTVNDIKDIIKYADFFTPNDKEAMALTDTENAKDALKSLTEYTKNPIVKTGKNGCIAFIDNKIVNFPAPKVKCVDTTGAGDNFLAGLIFGIYRNLPIEKCVELANIAGTLSVTEKGCYSAKYDLNNYL